MIDLDAAATRAISALGRKPSQKDWKILHASIRRELKRAADEAYLLARSTDMFHREWAGVPTTARFVECFFMKIVVLPKNEGVEPWPANVP